jgi:hypothetical protein
MASVVWARAQRFLRRLVVRRSRGLHFHFAGRHCVLLCGLGMKHGFKQDFGGRRGLVVPAFPARNRGLAHADGVGQLGLRPIAFLTQTLNEFSDVHVAFIRNE